MLAAVIKLMKDQANILEMQIHEMNTAMADLSFGEPVSQSQQELYTPPQPPLVPPPQSPFGETLVPPLPSPFGDPLLPSPSSSFGEALVPLSSPFGEPFRDHFIGTNFSNYSPWN